LAALLEAIYEFSQAITKEATGSGAPAATELPEKTAQAALAT
jgi:hypothetical protein